MSEQMGPMYGRGARHLQDRFDSRRLADRLLDVTLHSELNDDDCLHIEAQSWFVLATVDEHGWPDVSYKGGDPGIVSVVDRTTLRFPSYDGNGMFRSLGNIADNGRVAMLFVDTARPWRLRLHGTATVITDEAAVEQSHGAQAVVEVQVGRVFPNCGRYIHKGGGEISKYVPRPGYEPPVPGWKELDAFRDVLPSDQQDI